MTSFWKFVKGILLRGETSDPTDNLEGSLWYNSTSDRFKGYAESAVREVVTTDQTQTLTNKTFTGATITDPVITIDDNNLTIQDGVDNTKQAKFSSDAITTATTRTFEFPDADGQITLNAATQSLTNKTIDGDLNTVQDLALTSLKTVLGDANEVLHRDGSGVVTSSNTMPSGTIVGTTDTQTLTNKTIDGDLNTVQDLALTSLKTEVGSPNTVLTRNGSGTVVSTKASPTGDFIGTTDTQTLTNKTINILDTNLSIQDNSDPTKQAKFEASGITTGTTRTYTFPDANTTIVGTDATQTLSNKNIINTNTINVQDTNFTIEDNAVSNKVARFETSGISAATTRTFTFPDANTTLVGTDATQTLTNKTLTSPTITTGLIDNGLDFIEETSFTNPSAGNRRFGLKTDGKLYLRDSSGNEKVIGEGSSSGINYIDNPDAETDTTGWATYADAAGSTPVDGTGGSPNVTWTRTTSTPLRGTGSFLFTKDAANRQGQGASYDFTIDDADKAKVLAISFDYEIASGTYADGDLTAYIYDVTNALVIQPAGFTILNTGIESKQIATFQTASNSTSYRLIYHVASTSASAYTVKIDNVIVGPQIVQYGAPVSDWISFTPTINNLSVTSTTGKWRRVGDTMHVRVTSDPNGAATGVISLNLPSGYSIDTTKVPLASAANSNFGTAMAQPTNGGAASWFLGTVTYDSTTSIRVFNTASASNQYWDATRPATWDSTGTALSFDFVVPVVGWSSSVQMSNDTDTRVVAAKYTTTTVTNSIPNTATFTIVDYPTKVYDTHNAVTTGASWKYTAPVAGKYKISGKFLTGGEAWTAGNNLQLRLFKNGSSDSSMDVLFIPVTGTQQYIMKGTAEIDLIAGDFVDIRASHNRTGGSVTAFEAAAAFNQIEVERLSGPSAIAASETVAAQMDSSTTTLVNNTQTTVIFSTARDDSHGSLTLASGLWTAPISGRYFVSARISLGAVASLNTANGRNLSFTIQKNAATTLIASDVDQAKDTVSRGYVVNGSGYVKLIAGDTLRIRAAQNFGNGDIALDGGQSENFFHIIRVGN